MSQHLVVSVFVFYRWWCPVWNGHLTDWNHTSKSKWPGISRASGLACRNQCCEPSWQPSSLALCLAAGCNVCKTIGIQCTILTVHTGTAWPTLEILFIWIDFHSYQSLYKTKPRGRGPEYYVPRHIVQLADCRAHLPAFLWVRMFSRAHRKTDNIPS